jgi:hypothetical protein
MNNSGGDGGGDSEASGGGWSKLGASLISGVTSLGSAALQRNAARPSPAQVKPAGNQFATVLKYWPIAAGALVVVILLVFLLPRRRTA